MATDQEIRDAGFKYIPEQKYLQSPFQLPTDDPVTDQGIVATNAFAGSGGDGFSVYNADPNTITNMNPNMKALQDARYDNELSYVGKTLPGDLSPLYNTSTAAMKSMEINPDYYGMDTIGDRFELDEKSQLVMDSEGNYIRKNQPSKISELIGKGIGFIPGIGTLSKFADFASGLLPVNRRAIMENQLGTQGVMVNDIGQIVVGPGGSYNTPEGIMAGYNVSKMDDETFTDRIGTIENTLKDKYNMTDAEIADVKAGKYKGDVDTNLFETIRNIEIARKNFGNATGATDTIFNIKTDTKTNNQNDGSGSTNNNKDNGGKTGSGNFSNIDNSGKDYGPYSGGAGGIHSNYMNGGLASIL